MAREVIGFEIKASDQGASVTLDKVAKRFLTLTKQIDAYNKKADKSAKTTEKTGEKAKEASTKLSDLSSVLGGTGGRFASLLGTLRSVSPALLGIAAGIGVVVVAIKAATAAFRGFVAILSEALRKGKEFQLSLAEVRTIADETEFPMGRLTKVTSDLAAAYGVMPVEGAKALYQAISAGAVTAASANRILTTSAKFAIAGLTKMSSSVEMISASVNSFRLQNLRAEEAADVLFTTIRLGVTTGRDLAASLGNVLPMASAVGITFKELGAAIGTLTKRGVKTNTAVVQLRQAFAQIVKPTSMAAREAKRLGIEFNATTLKQKGLAQFMQDITTNAKFTRNSLALLFGNVRALSAVYGLTIDQMAEFEFQLEQQQQAADATNTAFSIVNSTTANLATRFEALREAMFSLAGEALMSNETIRSFMASVVQAMTDLLAHMQTNEFRKTLDGIVADFAKFAAEIIDIVIDMIRVIDEGFLSVATSIGGGIGDAINKLLNPVSSRLIDLLPSFEEFHRDQLARYEKIIAEDPAMARNARVQAAISTSRSILNTFYKETDRKTGELEKRLLDLRDTFLKAGDSITHRFEVVPPRLFPGGMLDPRSFDQPLPPLDPAEAAAAIARAEKLEAARRAYAKLLREIERIHNRITKAVDREIQAQKELQITERQRADDNKRRARSIVAMTLLDKEALELSKKHHLVVAKDERDRLKERMSGGEEHLRKLLEEARQQELNKDLAGLKETQKSIEELVKAQQFSRRQLAQLERNISAELRVQLQLRRALEKDKAEKFMAPLEAGVDKAVQHSEKTGGVEQIKQMQSKLDEVSGQLEARQASIGDQMQAIMSEGATTEESIKRIEALANSYALLGDQIARVQKLREKLGAALNKNEEKRHKEQSKRLDQEARQHAQLATTFIGSVSQMAQAMIRHHDDSKRMGQAVVNIFMQMTTKIIMLLVKQHMINSALKKKDMAETAVQTAVNSAPLTAKAAGPLAPIVVPAMVAAVLGIMTALISSSMSNTFHEGGFVGPGGRRMPLNLGPSETMAVLRQGEAVIPTAKMQGQSEGGGQTNVTLNMGFLSDPSRARFARVVDTDIVPVLRDGIKSGRVSIEDRRSFGRRKS